MEAAGYTGGIWLFWDHHWIHVELIASHDQSMNVLVMESMSTRPWLLSLIYASPQPLVWEQLWRYLARMGEFVRSPWIIAGDCNQPLEEADKLGGRPVNRTRAALLCAALDADSMMDLGFHGPRFTWTNGQQGVAGIRERIDRAWSNVAWQQYFLDICVHHLPRVTFDHHPVLVSSSTHDNQRFRGFRFLDPWFQHPDFSRCVEQLWMKESGSLGTALERFKNGIMDWNRHTFKNIFWRKHKCRARLLRVQRAVSLKPKRSLLKLETKLLAEFEHILNLEESYWRQKARANWICQGERNTRFFHATVIDRRSRNRILQLKLEDGSWCTDEVHLQNMAYNFYRHLYSKEPTAPLEPHAWQFPSLPRGSLRWLNREVVDSEVRRAVFQLGRHKAPDPDGILACFYQAFWPLVGDSVVVFVKEIFASGIVPANMNDSFICLIPKQTHPESISQFRPICLSNVIMKVISKIIANCLKPLLGDLVGQEQASFIPGRQTSDNIVMAQELLHFIRRRKGRKGHMVVKVDLEKAYDRIDWVFL